MARTDADRDPGGRLAALQRAAAPVSEPDTVPIRVRGAHAPPRGAPPDTAPRPPARGRTGSGGRVPDARADPRPATGPARASAGRERRRDTGAGAGQRPGRAVRLAARWLPASVAARLDPGRPGAVALVLVVAVAAALAAVGVWTAQPEVQPVGAVPAAASGSDGPATGPAPSAAPAAGSTVVVSVVGKVARPGLVRVPDGARVADGVVAAGGALPGVDLSVLNLARRISDGEQIAVGIPPAVDAAPGGGPASGREPGTPVAGPLPDGGAATSGSPPSGASPAPGGKLNLNQATADQLDALPGVGPVTATKIIDWRNRNGRFARVEQLREVDGIGERRYAQLAALVTV